MTEDELAGELQALGRTLVVPPPADDLVERVLARVAEAPAPRRMRSAARARTRRRRVIAVVVALVLLGLGLTPPVRAAVVEWLRIGGVLVRTAPPAGGPSPTASPPPAGETVTLAEARSLVSFPVGIPAELGPPDRVSVSADRRVVGMDWGTSRPEHLHLDQLDGELSWVFVKRTRDRFEITDVGGRDAVWFPTAHQVSYVDRDGRERTEQARTAGPCLVWERLVDGKRVTLRLEGDQTLARAVSVAESVR